MGLVCENSHLASRSAPIIILLDSSLSFSVSASFLVKSVRGSGNNIPAGFHVGLLKHWLEKHFWHLDSLSPLLGSVLCYATSCKL